MDVEAAPLGLALAQDRQRELCVASAEVAAYQLAFALDGPGLPSTASCPIPVRPRPAAPCAAPPAGAAAASSRTGPAVRPARPGSWPGRRRGQAEAGCRLPAAERGLGLVAACAEPVPGLRSTGLAGTAADAQAQRHPPRRRVRHRLRSGAASRRRRAARARPRPGARGVRRRRGSGTRAAGSCCRCPSPSVPGRRRGAPCPRRPRRPCTRSTATASRNWPFTSSA